MAAAEGSRHGEAVLMNKWRYTKGLHDLGRGCFAYLQPDGSWGWSNAGLVADGDETLPCHEGSNEVGALGGLGGGI